MNMTIVLLSKRTMELLMLLVCALSLLACADATGPKEDATQRLVDESHELTNEEFNSIAQQLGTELSGQVENDLEQLIESAEKSAQRRNEPERQLALSRLREANKAASKDIKACIGLVGDQNGALPQMSLRGAASSILAQANLRLQKAGQFIGSKLRDLSSYIAPRIPPRMRRYFRWPAFLKFKLRFNKVYKSPREDLYRQMIYLKTHISVGVQQIRFFLGKDKHLLGATQYADMSNKEFHEKVGNELAEKSQADGDSSVLRNFNPGYKARMEQLRDEKKNIFDVSLDEFKGGSKRRPPGQSETKLEADGEKNSGSKRTRRNKRAAVPAEDDDSMESFEELSDEDEEGELYGSPMDTLETLLLEDADDDDVDPEKLFEEFANAQVADLDEVSNTLDEALEEQDKKAAEAQEAERRRKEHVYDPFGFLDLPEEVGDDFKPIDLRKTGCLIRPENQGNCGACYAYALNSAAAYFNCMENYHQKEKLVRYHPYFTSQCGRYMFRSDPHIRPQIDGCRGGVISRAYRFITMVGVQRHTDYSVARQSVGGTVGSDECIFPRPEELNMSFAENSHEVPFFLRSRMVQLKATDLDLHLRTVGPVFLNVRTWANMGFMQAGIYGGIEEDDRPTMHSMLIVGHDKDMFNRDYWIIWNSFGVNWGEGGFLRLYTRSLKHFTSYLAGLQPSEF